MNIKPGHMPRGAGAVARALMFFLSPAAEEPRVVVGYAAVNGTTLYYETAGQGKAVVLLRFPWSWFRKEADNEHHGTIVY